MTSLADAMAGAARHAGGGRHPRLACV